MLTDEAAMARAIALAWHGWGRVAPNPMVGCVLVKDGEPVAEGWHAEYGGVHAERMALDAAGAGARGATAVVTLEPCAHQGKQPPCTVALIEAGVVRVVAAVADPDPIAQGGAVQLRSAGIPVEFGLLEAQARRQNAAFFHHHANPDRPWVTLKLATSLDGRIADGCGRSRWVSGEMAREWVHRLRAGFDAIAVGGATAVADDPSLTVRGTVTPRVAPRRVVFAGRQGLPGGLRLLAHIDGSPAIVVARRDAPGRSEWERAGAETLVAESLAEGLRGLRQGGVLSLLVEGGGRLAGALLKEGLVDRCALVQAPVFLGPAGVPAVAGLDIPLAEADRWIVVERKPLGNDTLLVLDRP